MTVKLVSYADVRPLMRTGDVIAFADNSLMSLGIRLATAPKILGARHVASHLGTVMRLTAPQSRTDTVEVVEARRSGVTRTQLSLRLRQYERNGGRLWCLPIRRDLPVTAAQLAEVERFLLSMEGCPYGVLRALASASALVVNQTRGRNDKARVIFCSELVAEVLAILRLIPADSLVGEATPRDVTILDLYPWTLHQLVGKATSLSGYCSIPPALAPAIFLRARA